MFSAHGLLRSDTEQEFVRPSGALPGRPRCWATCAQLAVCIVAERGLQALVGRYGAATLDRYIDALHDHAEAAMRDTIRALPNGRFDAEDFLDGMGSIRSRCASPTRAAKWRPA